MKIFYTFSSYIIQMQTILLTSEDTSPSVRVNIVQCFCTILSDPTQYNITEQQTVANMQAKVRTNMRIIYYIHGRVDDFGMCAKGEFDCISVLADWGCICGYSTVKSLLVSSVLFGGLKCSVRCFEIEANTRGHHNNN